MEGCKKWKYNATDLIQIKPFLQNRTEVFSGIFCPNGKAI